MEDGLKERWQLQLQKAGREAGSPLALHKSGPLCLHSVAVIG